VSLCLTQGVQGARPLAYPLEGGFRIEQSHFFHARKLLFGATQSLPQNGHYSTGTGAYSCTAGAAKPKRMQYMSIPGAGAFFAGP
jgi:hypothetical protein